MALCHLPVRPWEPCCTIMWPLQVISIPSQLLLSPSDDVAPLFHFLQAYRLLCNSFLSSIFLASSGKFLSEKQCHYHLHYGTTFKHHLFQFLCNSWCRFCMQLPLYCQSTRSAVNHWQVCSPTIVCNVNS